MVTGFATAAAPDAALPPTVPTAKAVIVPFEETRLAFTVPALSIATLDKEPVVTVPTVILTEPLVRFETVVTVVKVSMVPALSIATLESEPVVTVPTVIRTEPEVKLDTKVVVPVSTLIDPLTRLATLV